MWKKVKPYLLIALACIPYAFALNAFYVPNNLTCGGFTGIAQIINAWVPSLSVGVLVIVLNVPLFLLSFRHFGLKLQLHSFFTMAVSSLMIDGLASVYTFKPLDPLLACLYGGVILGVAIGVLLSLDASTGGSDLCARLLKLKIPHLPIGRLILFIDVAVVVIYAAVFRSVENALYGIISLYVSSVVMDLVVYGGNAAKLAYIISERGEDITRRLLDGGIGVTLLDAKGAYSGQEKPVLLCAIRRREMVAVKRLVKETDPAAFFIVCDASEVLGEGFGEYKSNGL